MLNLTSINFRKLWRQKDLNLFSPGAKALWLLSNQIHDTAPPFRLQWSSRHTLSHTLTQPCAHTHTHIPFSLRHVLSSHAAGALGDEEHTSAHPCYPAEQVQRAGVDRVSLPREWTRESLPPPWRLPLQRALPLWRRKQQQRQTRAVPPCAGEEHQVQTKAHAEARLRGGADRSPEACRGPG